MIPITRLTGLLESKQLFIFDLDGTIADTSPIHERAFNEALVPLGVTVDYGSIAGLTTEAAMCRVLQDTSLCVGSAEIDLLVRQKRDIARRLIAQQSAFLPGAKEFVLLARQRYRMAICSSGSRETVELTLRTLGIRDFFTAVVTGEDVNRAKPEPDGFLTVLKLLAIPAVQALVFEDAPSGLTAGVQAGLDVIHVSSNAQVYELPGVFASADWPQLLCAIRGLP